MNKPKIGQHSEQSTHHKVVLGGCTDIPQHSTQPAQARRTCQFCGYQCSDRIRAGLDIFIHLAICKGIITSGSEANKKSQGQGHKKIEQAIFMDIFHPIQSIVSLGRLLLRYISQNQGNHKNWNQCLHEYNLYFIRCSTVFSTTRVLSNRFSIRLRPARPMILRSS